MMVEKQKKTLLADSDAAVFSLLESLLQEVDEQVRVEVPTETKPATQTKTEVEVKKPETAPITEVIEQPVTTEVIAPVAEAAPVEEALETADLPEWTAEKFSCLLFDVEGTELAVPLAMLDSIAVWDQEATQVPTQPDWHLGVIKHRDNNVIALDTARLIMPEKITETAEQRRLQHGSHLLVVKQRWALSCDGIKQTIQLDPQQVRWRPQRNSRVWALGTLVDRLCVLLDPEILIQEISS
ncbi:MAG: chemotaxis protein CheW [Chromatiales bacterium]|jgi:purine-binding chemotaxis protein CheW